MSCARLLVYRALTKVFSQNAYSTIVFNNEIKKSTLSDLDISFSTVLFYGVLEKKITLDYVISKHSSIRLTKISNDVLTALRMGVYQIIFMDKVPTSAAVNESVNLIGKNKGARGFVNAILRSVARNRENLFFENDAVKYSCPEWLIDHFRNSYGSKITDKILRSLDQHPNLIIRVNTVRTEKSKLMDLLEKDNVKVSDLGKTFDALKLNYTRSIEDLEAFKQGLFHVQDLSSQICCSVLSPSETDTVVDVCAAPGGKTFTLAELMNGKGSVIAFDLYESKVNLVKKGAKRLGLDNISVFVNDSSVPFERENFADKVICDVPCSGLGIIKRKPEIKYKEKNWFKNLPDLQLKILSNASRLVKIHGQLLYSTCTLNPEENSGVVERFLELNDNFCQEKIILPEGIVRELCEPLSQFTIIPGTNNSDGFFIALMRRLR